MYGMEYYRYSDIKYIDQLQVWSSIIGYNINIGDKFCNPCRHDKNPKCTLKQWGDVILLTDWARPEFNTFTCVHAYAYLHRLDLDTAISQIIQGNLGVLLPSYNNKIERRVKKEKSKINFESFVNEDGEVAFREIDAIYWKLRGITKEQLLKDGVYAVYRYSINGFQYYPKQCYAYTFKSGNIKLYQPYSEKRKWTSNTGVDDVWRIGDWTEDCIITKAYKDARIIHNLTGLRVYAYMNEGVLPHNLEELYSHKRKYILYDNDDAGIAATERVVKEIEDIIPLFLPVSLAKDIDEVRVKYGEEISRNVLRNLLHKDDNHHFYFVPDRETMETRIRDLQLV